MSLKIIFLKWLSLFPSTYELRYFFLGQNLCPPPGFRYLWICQGFPDQNLCWISIFMNISRIPTSEFLLDTNIYEYVQNFQIRICVRYQYLKVCPGFPDQNLCQISIFVNMSRMKSSFMEIGSSLTNKVRADSTFSPCQWETALLCNDVPHWLGASLEDGSDCERIASSWCISILWCTECWDQWVKQFNSEAGNSLWPSDGMCCQLGQYWFR